MFETSFDFIFVTFRCLQQVWEFYLVHHNEFWSFYCFNTHTSSQCFSFVLWAARLGLLLRSHSPISYLILLHVAMFYLLSAYYTAFQYDFPQCEKNLMKRSGKREHKKLQIRNSGGWLEEGNIEKGVITFHRSNLNMIEALINMELILTPHQVMRLLNWATLAWNQWFQFLMRC